MPIKLKCVEKKLKNQAWQIDLDGEHVVLVDAEGQVATQLSHEEAPQHFQMPSFSESIKTFGVMVDGWLIRFDVVKDDLKQIKTYLSANLAASGPEAMLVMRNKALGGIALGAAVAVGGAVFSWFSYQAAANNPEGGQYTLTHGVVLVGLIILGKGVYNLLQYNKAKNMAE